MTERFAGKVALVTGATRGIGAATVRRLAREGARVAFCGRTVDAGSALVAELGGPENVLYVAADLSRPDDCAKIVDAAVAQFGRLDILVNNAASVLRGTLEDTSAADFDAMIALNLRAPFLTMQRALPTFKAQFEREGVGGVIVNIGSINSYIGANNLMAYSASKGGLLTLSRNLAGALGPWRIRVHVFNVGWVLTEGEEVIQRAEGAPDDWAERAGANRPWGRLMSGDDIAAAVAFYASDDAKVFSGGVIALEQHPF
jgi:NAD(P)-dependent dehydrogenase (short-subunit alcohol dehydrogenase family)